MYGACGTSPANHVLKQPKVASVSDRLIELFVSVRGYRMKYGGIPNLIRPETFTEKVLHRILFDRRPILTTLSDKYAVREYVKARIGEHVLPRLHWATISPEDIPFDTLPNKFVVKATHGSHWIRIVLDKTSVDCDELIEKCRWWLRQNYYYAFREPVYRNIEPRILVEELLSDGTGLTPTDYKCFVFDGTVRMVQVVQGYLTGVRMSFYELPWRKLRVSSARYDRIEEVVPRPKHLDDLIACAEALGRGIDFLRVDLYDTDAHVYFGEMSVTPGAGRFYFDSREFDRYLGGLWKISVKP